MINIAINDDVYNWANSYAKEHHTSIKEIVENYLSKLRHSSAQTDDAEAKLQQLIGMTKGMRLDAEDLNGDKTKQAYLDEKYAN